MVTDDSTRRSRRAVLASAAAGAAALAATRLSAPSTVTAADGGTMILGQTNTATATTTLSATGGLSVLASGASSILANNVASSGIAINGQANGIGVRGLDGSGQFDPFLNGPGTSHVGVYGFTGNTGGVGVSGLTAVNGGTLGLLGAGDTGGRTIGSTGGLAAWGYQPGSFGVHAHVSSNSNVQPPAGAASTALYGTVDNRGAKFGLQVQGRVRLVDRSGRIAIAKGKSSATRTVSGVTGSNIAVATLNTDRSGNAVRAVVCSTGRITIHLLKAVPRRTYVSWIVLG